MILIGDHIVDKAIYGKSTRLSPEAPVPVITNTHEKISMGGAGNVHKNLQALGESVLFVRNPDQRTVKTRIYANGHILCRIDEEQYIPYMPDLNFDMTGHNLAIISDYNKGVVDNPITIIGLLNKQNLKVLVDPKKKLKFYQGAWLIKMNEAEFTAETEHAFDPTIGHLCCRDLCEKYGFAHIIVTRGAKGFFHYMHNMQNSILELAEEKNVLDVTGAGDVFIAALAHFINQGNSVRDAAVKANKLAGISVGHMGTYTLTKKDIETVKPKVVFTNGCFDILHPGHIHLLNESKKLGGKLIVGLNSDASVKRLKGRERPILTQDRRKKMLEALGIADEVIIFDEDTPFELIQRIKPDIITKGGDYVPETVVGAALAEVVIIPTVQGYSTTGVIDEIKRKS